MATQYLKGNDITVELDTTAIGLEKGCKISIGTGLEDESTKDDGYSVWDNQSVASKNWSVSVDANIKNDGSNAATLLKEFISCIPEEDATLLEIFGHSASQPMMSGNVIMTQLDIDAQVKQIATISATFTGVGALA